MILKYIKEGKSEFRAKKLVRLDLAKRGKMASKSTIDRLWVRHGEILNELSGEEFFGQLLQAIFTVPDQQGSREEVPNQQSNPEGLT